MPTWSIGLTDPIGQGWYEGQLRLGVEVHILRTDRPLVTESVAVTPKMTYVFTHGGHWRPFIDGGGGPIWTELGGKIPEQPGWFNFLVFGGGGVSYAVTPRLSLVLGGRFAHISNAGTRPTNRGVNYGLPYVGLSWVLF
ncbi:MAG: acyloxyacyl hydrolase [Nitrospiraceae bacterium]